MRCLETSRRLSQFVGEEIYNVVPFLFINYRIYMALDETMKTILIYVWRSKYRNSLRSGLPKKMGKSKDRPWSQVNEEKLDIERDSLPAQDIIQETKAELFTFFLVSVCFIFFKRLLKTVSTDCEFICRRKYFKWILFRRGSRITTDRFPKQGPRCKLLGAFYEADKFGPKVLFPGFLSLQTGYWPVPFSSDEALQIGGLFHQG